MISVEYELEPTREREVLLSKPIFRHSKVFLNFTCEYLQSYENQEIGGYPLATGVSLLYHNKLVFHHQSNCQEFQYNGSLGKFIPRINKPIKWTRISSEVQQTLFFRREWLNSDEMAWGFRHFCYNAELQKILIASHGYRGFTKRERERLDFRSHHKIIDINTGAESNSISNNLCYYEKFGLFAISSVNAKLGEFINISGVKYLCVGFHHTPLRIVPIMVKVRE